MEISELVLEDAVGQLGFARLDRNFRKTCNYKTMKEKRQTYISNSSF